MLWLWVGFVVLVGALLILDLAVIDRKAHVVGVREALKWTVFWICLAAVFSGLVYLVYQHHWFEAGTGTYEPMDGWEAWVKFVTGYLVEKSLSLDNMFVIAVIFTYFGVERQYQHRTLFWGIIGAMVMRGVMIGAGVTLLHRFDWMMQVFGGLLLLTAIKMAVTGDESVHPERNPIVKLARRVFPVTTEYHAQRFFVRLDGRLVATPLFLVLLVIESSDVVFAVDSIPAIFGITQDPFIIFSSNILAILGLRSLYFVLAGMMARFHYIRYSLVAILFYISLKMLAPHHVKLDPVASLGMIAFFLALGVAVSMVTSRRTSQVSATGSDDGAGAAEPDDVVAAADVEPTAPIVPPTPAASGQRGFGHRPPHLPA